MRNKKIIIEEISRMRSMMGLNENFIPRLLVESVTPQRLKQLMSEFIGATDNASRRSIINNLSTDEKQIFNDYLSEPGVTQYFGGVRNVDEFINANVGNELMKLAKLIAIQSDAFVKKAGKNINFASSIDNLARIEKELDDLKPSIANLANDIDPNSDYGNLIRQITQKQYGDIDLNVWNDFANFLLDLKTKTTDPNVQQYLDGVYDDMLNISGDIDEVIEARKLADTKGSDNIVGDNGEYIDSNFQLVDSRGNLIDDSAFMKNQFDELGLVDDMDVLRLSDADEAIDDVETQTTKLQSNLKTAIINSTEFKKAAEKLPSNINADQLADQISLSIAEKLKKEINLIPESRWLLMPVDQKMLWVDKGLAGLKKASPTKYEKLKTKISNFFAKDPSKLSKKKLYRIWAYGAAAMAAYQIYDVINTTQTQGGDAGDVTRRIIDGILQTAIWPVSVGTLGSTSIEKDYVNTREAFIQWAIDNGLATDQNYKEKVDFDDKGVFYVKKTTGAGPNKKEDFVPYEYDLRLGTFVEKSNTAAAATTSATPPTTTGGSITDKNVIETGLQGMYPGVKIKSFSFVKKDGDVEEYSAVDSNDNTASFLYNTKTKAFTKK